jgi:hypothetical protein
VLIQVGFASKRSNGPALARSSDADANLKETSVLAFARTRSRKHWGVFAAAMSVAAAVAAAGLLAFAPGSSVAASVATPTTGYAVFSRPATAADVIPASNPLAAAIASQVPEATVRALQTAQAGITTWALAGNGQICVAGQTNASGLPAMACGSASTLTANPNGGPSLMSVSASMAGPAAANTSNDIGYGNLVLGLAPDGIQNVTITLGDGTSARVPVIDNGFQLTTSHLVTIASVSWTDAAGATHTKETGQ